VQGLAHVTAELGGITRPCAACEAPGLEEPSVVLLAFMDCILTVCPLNVISAKYLNQPPINQFHIWALVAVINSNIQPHKV